MDTNLEITLLYANSMKVFSDGEPTFNYGDWKAWKAACFAENKTIPPKEFKALPIEARRAYLTKIRQT
jgi:hypothetical protein